MLVIAVRQTGHDIGAALVGGRDDVIVFMHVMQIQCPHGTMAVSHSLVTQTGQQRVVDVDATAAVCSAVVGAGCDAGLLAVAVAVAVARAARRAGRSRRDR